MANGWGPERGPGTAVTRALALGGAGAAVLALVLAGATGEPYLGSDGVNAWIVVFAAAMLCVLFAFPFALEPRLRERYADRDRRWEVTLVAWGAVAVGLLAVALSIGLGTSTLAETAALVVAIEAAIVVATIAMWLLAGG